MSIFLKEVEALWRETRGGLALTDVEPPAFLFPCAKFKVLRVCAVDNFLNRRIIFVIPRESASEVYNAKRQKEKT